MTGGIDDKQLMAAVVLMERFIRDIYLVKHSSAIQPLQWSILRYLHRMPSDRCEVRWIAQFLGLTRAPITRAVATLEARNLVVLRNNEHDARTKSVSLTIQGIKVLSDDPIIEAVTKVRNLSEVDKSQFIRTVRALALNSEGTSFGQN